MSIPFDIFLACSDIDNQARGLFCAYLLFSDGMGANPQRQNH